MSIQDRVAIRLSGGELLFVESYNVETAIMTQPGRWTCRTGNSGVAKELVDAHKPGSKFELFVSTVDGEVVPQFVGTLDRRGMGGTETTVIFGGRDALGPLHANMPKADKAYGNLTYIELVAAVIADAGMKVKLTDSTHEDNARKAGGTAVPNSIRWKSKGFKKRTKIAVSHPPQIKVGETYYAFLDKILKKAGMFLVALSDGSLALMQPDPDQKPVARIHNRRALRNAEVSSATPGNVIDFEWQDDTTGRYSEIIVYGNSGTATFGRELAVESFTDKEVAGFGIQRFLSIKDKSVSSLQEAQFFAERKRCEQRRAGRTLSYVLAGHTTIGLDGGRRVWARDTCVLVTDDDLGYVDEPHYVEGVALNGDSNHTTTMVKLMRPEDMLFGGDES